MAAISRLAVELTLDSAKFNSGLKSAQQKLGDFGTKARQVGGMMTAAVTLPVVGAFGAMINAASDLSEAQSAVTATFGESAAAIIKASETSATSVGMSAEQYLTASKIMGVYGKAAGLAGDDLVAFSKDTVAAAADLASFHNVPMDEALAAIQSGLSGETEPLKRFGILMNEAALQAYALENGIWDGTGAMTEQQKVLARQGFIMKNLGPAVGDFAKTSGGLANQMRILRARLTDVAAKMGQHLLPIALKAANFFGKLMDRFDKFSDRTQKIILIVAAFAAALGPLLIVLGSVATAVAALAPVFALLTGPIGLIILAVVALAIAWKKNLFDIQGKTKAFLKFIQPAIDTVVALFTYLRDVLTNDIQPGDLAKLPKWLQPIAYVLGRVTKTLRIFIKTWMDKGFLAALRTIPTQIRAFGRAISRLLGAAGLDRAARAFKSFFYQLGVVFGNAVTFFDNLVHGRWKEAWEAFKDLAISLVKLWWEGMKAQFALFRDLFDKIPWGTIGQALLAGLVLALDFLVTTGIPYAMQKAGELMGAILSGLQTFWDDTVAPWLMSLPGRMFEVLASDETYTLLYNAGHFLIEGFSQAVMAGWNWFAGWFATIPAALAGVFNGIFWPFYETGQNIMQGLIQGIASLYNTLAGWVDSILGQFGRIPGMGRSPWPSMIEAGSDAVEGLIVGVEKRQRALAGALGGTIGTMTTGTPNLSAMPAVSGAGAGGGMMQPISIRTVVVENPANGQEVVAEILRAVKRTKAGLA
jgi:hypothetical protein